MSSYKMSKEEKQSVRNASKMIDEWWDKNGKSVMKSREKYIKSQKDTRKPKYHFEGQKTTMPVDSHPNQLKFIDPASKPGRLQYADLKVRFPIKK